MDWFLYDSGLHHKKVKLFRVLKISMQSVLRRFTVIDEKPDFNNEASYGVL